MIEKIFNPEKYGMAICPSCDSHGYIQNPKRRCCPKCGGVGFIIKEAEGGAKTFTSNHCLSWVPGGELGYQVT